MSVDQLDLTKRILSYVGSVIDQQDETTFDALLPLKAQTVLGLAELARFSTDARTVNVDRLIAYDNEFFERCSALLGKQGTVLTLNLEAQQLPRIRNAMHPELSLSNATFRAREAVAAHAPFIGVVFRYRAVSEERRDSSFAVWINLSNNSIRRYGTEELLSAVARVASAENMHNLEAPVSLRFNAQLKNFVRRAISQDLDPFQKGLSRRIEQDSERLRTYFSDLKRSLLKNTSGGANEEIRAVKVQSVEREYQAKIADLERAYTTAISVEVSQVVHVTTPVLRINYTIMRRKAERNFNLDWNPVFKKFDPVCCERCGRMEGPMQVVDSSCELLCRDCY